MLKPERPADERERIEALHALGVLDTASEEVFDDITNLAAVICEAPMALLSFVDTTRAWFKSKVGITADEAPRSLSFCTHALDVQDVFVVADATQDERFKGNPLVEGEPHIRFYAGAPLRDRGGHAVGMICVLDGRPRKLKSSQLRALRVLARLVMAEMELRQSSEQLQKLEVEAANLRLVRTMAGRLLHEIGNAMVPLSTHQQLLSERYDDPQFRVSLDAALSEVVRRVFRLINQMRYLAEEGEQPFTSVSLQEVVQQAFQTATRTPKLQSGRLNFEVGKNPILIQADVNALSDAIGEILINAFQANLASPEANVRCSVSRSAGGLEQLVIDVLDNGSGFQPDALEGATKPFFSTRNVGPGLGLAVAKQIIEKHGGVLEIHPPAGRGPGSVRILLPLPNLSNQRDP